MTWTTSDVHELGPLIIIILYLHTIMVKAKVLWGCGLFVTSVAIDLDYKHSLVFLRDSKASEPCKLTQL